VSQGLHHFTHKEAIRMELRGNDDSQLWSLSRQTPEDDVHYESDMLYQPSLEDIQRIIKELYEEGLLEIVGQRGGRPVYAVTLKGKALANGQGSADRQYRQTDI
jgi:hypothetical protein